MNSYQEKNNFAAISEFQENLIQLREIDFFSEFPLEMLKVFAYQCTREAYKQGDFIFRQGDDDGRAYCIMSGEARLSRTDGDNEVFINTYGLNTFFGAFILAAKVNRPFSLIALTDTSCLALTRENFQEVIDQFPDSRQYVISGLRDIVLSWEKRFVRENLDCESCRRVLGVSIL